MTDTKELQSLLLKNGITLDELSKMMNLSRTSLSYKINNKNEFKTSEIKKIQAILRLTNEQRDSIFFGDYVDFKSTKHDSG